MIDLIKDRLEEYETRDAVQKLNAVKEILQEIALYPTWLTCKKPWINGGHGKIKAT